MTALGDKAVQLAQGLIRCESVTPADAGVLDVLIETLKPARFTFWRLTFKDEGTPPVDNLYARVGDGAAPSLSSPAMSMSCRRAMARCGRHPPFAAEIAGGILYGRGASDMKGAIACFTAAALDYVKSRGRELDGSISLPHHRRRGRPVHQRHAQGARLDEGAGRAARPLSGRRADQRQALGDTIKIGRRGSLCGTARR